MDEQYFKDIVDKAFDIGPISDEELLKAETGPLNDLKERKTKKEPRDN